MIYDLNNIKNIREEVMVIVMNQHLIYHVLHATIWFLQKMISSRGVFDFFRLNSIFCATEIIHGVMLKCYPRVTI